MIELGLQCRICGNVHPVLVDATAYDRWVNREILAQDAFPHLSPALRELLISRTCPECWDEMFGQDDSEEEEEEEQESRESLEGFWADIDLDRDRDRRAEREDRKRDH